ncbi:unnamed protein product [Caenorhabditis brenneri]
MPGMLCELSEDSGTKKKNDVYSKFNHAVKSRDKESFTLKQRDAVRGVINRKTEKAILKKMKDGNAALSKIKFPNFFIIASWNTSACQPKNYTDDQWTTDVGESHLPIRMCRTPTCVQTLACKRSPQVVILFDD